MTSADASTSLEISGETARFHVHTRDPAFASVLPPMGFGSSGADRFTRLLPRTDDIRLIHDNFARHLEEILQQCARLRHAPWEVGLREFMRRMESTTLDWWLVGSAALAVRGVDVAPKDVDLVVHDAAAVGHVLNDLLIYPVTRMEGWAAEWFGCAFAGCLIEWIAHPHPSTLYGDGLHEIGSESAGRLETLEWHSHLIRLPRLDWQLTVAEARTDGSSRQHPPICAGRQGGGNGDD